MFTRGLLLLVPRLLAVLERLLPWLATYAIHSTLLLLAALLLTSRHLPWRATAAVRDAIWKGAMVGGLFTATVQAFVDHAPVAGSWNLGARPMMAVREVRVTVTRDAPAIDLIAPDRRDAPDVRSIDIRRPGFALVTSAPTDALMRAALALLWLVGVAVAVIRHDRALTRLDRMLGMRTRADDSPAGLILRHLATRAGVTRRVFLTASEQLQSPAAIDGEEICVSARFLNAVNVLEQESILAHELAHLVRRDVLWLRITNLVVSIFFFQPLNRLARVRWQANAEFAADDWAVRLTGAPLQLARGLAAVASWLTAPPSRVVLPAMASARSSVLIQRVARLTAPHDTTAGAAPRWSRIVAVVVASLAATAAVAPRIELSSEHRERGLQRLEFEERVSQVEPSIGTRELRVLKLTDWPIAGQQEHANVVFRRVARSGVTADTIAVRAAVVIVRRTPAVSISN